MAYYLGVDLGTTFTAAAIARDGRTEVVHLGHKAAVVPSVVLVRDGGETIVGDAAARAAYREPDRVAREFKRRLGDPVPLLLGGQPYSPEQLMSRLLKHVVTTVIAREGGAPEGIVVTHPANWGGYKRELFEQAVGLADVGDVTTLTEPEAAAIHYASQERVPDGSIVAVYDFGGGTFDAAVLRKQALGYAFMGEPGGVDRLGGIDIDEAVVGHVNRAVGGVLEDLDPDDPTVAAALDRLRRDCIEAKEALSSDTEVSIPVLLPGLQTEVRLTRAELETYVRTPLQDTVTSMRRALSGAGVEPQDVSRFLLVGGSSRIPLVAQLVGAEFARPVSVDAHPKFAIALGAAGHAASLAAGAEPTTAPTVVVPSEPGADAPSPVDAAPPATPTPGADAVVPENAVTPPAPAVTPAATPTGPPATPTAPTAPAATPPTPAAPTPPTPAPAAAPRGPKRGVLIGGGAAALVAVVAGVALTMGGGGGDDPDDGATTAASATPSDAATDAGAGPDGDATPIDVSEASAQDLLTSPLLAEAAGADRLLTEGANLPQGSWSDVTDPAWRTKIGPLPVYVAEIQLGDGGQRVDTELTVALRGSDVDVASDEVVFRLIPATRGLIDVTVEEVRVDGLTATHTLDEQGGRLVVELPRDLADNDAVVVHVRTGFTVPDGSFWVGAGYDEAGALSRTGDQTLLLHWLPTLLYTDFPVPSFGGPDSHPAGYWSVVVHHTGDLRTAGTDGSCPTGLESGYPSCTWSRGVALRMHGGVLTGGITAEADRERGLLVAAADELLRAGVMLDTARFIDVFEPLYGTLPWTEIDAVVTEVPLDTAAFVLPGLTVIDASFASQVNGGAGSFINGALIGYQYFGGLVGNDEPNDPMLSRVGADYMALRAMSDVFGNDVASNILDQGLIAPYVAAAAEGIDGRASRPLSGYANRDWFDSLIHGRGVAAIAYTDFALVDAPIAQTIETFALGMGSSTGVLAIADGIDATLANDINLLWFTDQTLEELGIGGE